MSLKKVVASVYGDLNPKEQEEFSQLLPENPDQLDATMRRAYNDWDQLSQDERSELVSGHLNEDKRKSLFQNQAALENEQAAAADKANEVFGLERVADAPLLEKPIEALSYANDAIDRGVIGLLPKAKKAVGWIERTYGSLTGNQDWEKSGQDWNKDAAIDQQALDMAVPRGAPSIEETGVSAALPAQGLDAVLEMTPELGLMSAASAGLKAAGMGAKVAEVAGPALVMAPGNITGISDKIEQETGKFSPGTSALTGGAQAVLWSGALQKFLTAGANPDTAKKIVEGMAQRGNWGRIAEIAGITMKDAVQEAGKMAAMGTASNAIEQLGVTGTIDPVKAIEAAPMAAMQGVFLGGKTGFSEGMKAREMLGNTGAMTPEGAKSFAENAFPEVAKDPIPTDQDPIKTEIENPLPAENVLQPMVEGNKQPKNVVQNSADNSNMGITLTQKRISELFENAMAHPSGKIEKDGERPIKFPPEIYSPVSSEMENRIKDEGKVDVTGYVHALDHSSIRHLMKEHGDQAKEERQGQIALTKEDFLKLPELVASPDKIENGGKTDQGLDAIRLKKRINGHIIIVEEVRTGEKYLIPKSMYKIKAGASDAPLQGGGSSSKTSETFPGTNTNISQTPTDVKGTPDIQAFDQSTGRMDRRDINQAPVDPTITAPVKRSGIMALYQKLLPFRQDKLGMPESVLGIYKPKDEVSRLRDGKDIEVSPHELGHHLSKTLGMDDASLQPFAAELLPIASPSLGGKPTLQEGLAEFVRYYLTDPTKAAQKAPGFLTEFQNRVGANKELSSALSEIRAETERYFRQDPVMRLLSNVDVGKPMGIVEKARRFFGSFQDAYTMGVDSLEPLRKVEMAMNGGQLLPAYMSPYKLARLYAGWMGKASAMLDYKTFDYNTLTFNGEGLREIMKPVGNRLMDLRALLIARRVKEKYFQTNRSGKDIETGIRIEDALETLKRFEGTTIGKDAQGKDVTFNDVADKLYGYQDRLLDYMVQGGILSASDRAIMKAKNQDYIPFYRIMGEPGEGSLELGSGGTGKGLELRNSPVKGMKGSTRDIVDPIESVIKNTFAFLQATERNAVGQALVRLAKSKGGMGRFIEEIPDQQKAIQFSLDEIRRQMTPAEQASFNNLPQHLQDKMFMIFRKNNTPQQGVISVFENGKQKLYQVHPEIERVMKGLDRESSTIYEKILAAPANWLRTGATLTPEFMGRNFPMDTLSSALFSRYQVIPGIDLARAVFNGFVTTAKKNELYYKWMASGGGGAEIVALNREGLQGELERVTSNPEGLGYYTNLITSPKQTLEAMSKFSEQITRLGEFSLGVQKEGANKRGFLESALASRDVSLDFARSGAKTKGLNRIIAFMNAAIQGQDKFINGSVEQFRRDPLLMTARVAGYLVLPSMYLWYANKDDPRYQDVEQIIKDTHWIYIDGPNVTRQEWDQMTLDQKKDLVKNTVYRIPKPRELGLMFSSLVERIANKVWQKDPHAFDDFGDSLKAAFVPNLMPTAAAPILENILNKSMWTGQDLVPDSQQKLMPEAQYGPQTSEMAKAIGKTVGVAPTKVDNLGRGYGAGAYTYLSKAADAVGGATGILPQTNKPESLAADLPGIKGFSVPSFRRSEMVKRFNNQYQDASKRYNTMLYYFKRGKIDDAKRIQAKGQYEKIDGINQALGDLNAQIQNIQDDPRMDPEKKTDEILKLQIQKSDLARMGTQLYDQFLGLTEK